MRALLMAGTLLLMACEGNGFSPGTGEEQTWEYVAFTTDGVRAVEGTFHVVPKDRDFTGSWANRLVLPGAEVGPQVGTGKLSGSWDTEGQSVLLDLNPGWADNNVFLVARPDGANFSGEWSHSTITGPRTGGHFTATRTR